MSLEQIAKKIKSFVPDSGLGWGMVAIGLLGVLVYGIFLTYTAPNRAYAPSIISDAFTPNFDVFGPKTEGGKDKIGASIGGSVYYYPHCGGLGRIKPENTLYFNSPEEAEKAGFSLAKNCQKP